jgi:hypothetical protein
MIERFKSQSLNTCKRVIVSGHILEFFGHMGVEYSQLGEECDSRKVSQKQEICIG